jgi:hypothetical protein
VTDDPNDPHGIGQEWTTRTERVRLGILGLLTIGAVILILVSTR